MTQRAGDAWTLSALGAAVLSLVSACENDVAVQLLPTPASATPPGCAEGEPCSGRSWALSFEGAYDRVEIPSSPQLDLPQDFAFEAWVWVRSYHGGHGVLNRWVSARGDLQLTFGTPVPLSQLELPSSEPVPSHVLASWAFVKTDFWLNAVAPKRPTTQTWHHVATSYGGGSFRLYLDGKLAGSMDSTDTVPNPENALYIGATARWEPAFDTTLGEKFWPPIDGFIAEVRLSSTNRYPADFVPEIRLEADRATLALWHLDEGTGSTVSDSGPGSVTGSITGAQWALVPTRTAALPSSQ